MQHQSKLRKQFNAPEDIEDITDIKDIKDVKRFLQKLEEVEPVLKIFYRQCVANGMIDPIGKTDKELVRAWAKVLKMLSKQKTIYGITDYSNSILKHARQLRKKHDGENACLFYATWFEHWINALIFQFIVRKKLFGHNEFKELVRGMPIRVKYLCMPPLLGLPRIPEHHYNVVNDACDARNAYVHYKMTLVEIDQWCKEKTKWRKLFTRVERTVEYLKRYENKEVFSGLKDTLKLPGFPSRYARNALAKHMLSSTNKSAQQLTH